MATIDIGTNSVLMLVAERGADGSVCALGDELRVTRLGQGVDSSGALHADAVRRTLDALTDLAAIARTYGADIHAVGTSALRDARNGQLLLEPAREVLGSSVEVLSGSREAHLTFAGAGSGLGVDTTLPFTLVDIGGGSTEIVVGSGVEPRHAASLNVGVVRLTERHAVGAPASAEAVAGLRADAEHNLRNCSIRPVAPLVGIAGTVTTTAAIAQGLDRYIPDRIHGYRLGLEVVQRLAGELAAMDAVELRNVPGLPTDRADLIVAGTTLLACVMTWANASEVRVSTGGIRLGLAREKLAPNTVRGAD